MPGTISLGIYDAAGKLVRSLHKEASVESTAFFKEINGLVTWWDGKNDAGEPMPPGKYSAHGFTVGDLQIEGEAYHCNDWFVDENSPRIKRVASLGQFSDSILLGLELVDGKTVLARCLSSGSLAIPAEPVPELTLGPVLRDGQIYSSFYAANSGSKPLELPSLGTPVAVVGGRNDTIWVIDRTAEGATEVKQYSPKGEFLRRLAIDSSEPAPTKIAASSVSDAICLLEENAKCQRLRWLELSQAAPAQPETTGSSSQPVSTPVSTWKEVLRRTITFSDQFAQVQPELKLPGGKPVTGLDKVRIQLVPNPLLQEKAAGQDLALGFDAEGSYLKTTDGLLLKRITDTTGLKWAVMDRENGGKILVVFQGDGAVVEEYRVNRPGNMMAFDYGDFQLNPK